jgi:OOP family OmpA-OmpF porin
LIAGVQSANAAEGLYIAPGVQVMNFDSDTGYDNDSGGFLGLGYKFGEKTSLELSTFELGTDTSGLVDTDIDLDHYKLNLLYDLDAKIGNFGTFLLGGIGNTKFASDNETLLQYGAGVKYEISDNLEWRTAVRSNHFFDRERQDSDLGLDTSLVFYFGGGETRSRPAAPSRAAATPAAAPSTPSVADADRDGVPDSRDRCADTPRNYAVDANGCPIATEEVSRVELQVNFDFDQSVVKQEYFDEIQEVADFMEQYPDVIIELEGHTDRRGTEEYNQGLSERRANAVRGVLIDRYSIQASRISAEGFGESQPVSSNQTDAGRAENRRVMTVIIKTLQNYQPR